MFASPAMQPHVSNLSTCICYCSSLANQPKTFFATLHSCTPRNRSSRLLGVHSNPPSLPAPCFSMPRTQPVPLPRPILFGKDAASSFAHFMAYKVCAGLVSFCRILTKLCDPKIHCMILWSNYASVLAKAITLICWQRTLPSWHGLSACSTPAGLSQHIRKLLTV